MNECFCTNVNRQASTLSETHQHISDKSMPLLSETHMPQLNTSTKTSMLKKKKNKQACFYQTNLNAHMCTPTRQRSSMQRHRGLNFPSKIPPHELTQRCGCINVHTNTGAHNFPLRNSIPTGNAAAYTNVEQSHKSTDTCS